MRHSEAEKCFIDDIREKKKAASGVHSKTGKRGYVGKMRFPTDIMNRKDKMKYRRASKITMSNLFDEIITVEEFNNLEVFEQRNRLQYWRDKYTIREIQKGMGIPNNQYYNIIDRLELPRDRVANNKKKRTGSPAVRKTAPKALEPASIAPQPIQEVKAPVQEIIVSGMHLIFNGTYTPEEMQRQLLKYATLLDGESDDFYIELKIVQKPKKDAI
jgi:hypothetical protein